MKNLILITGLILFTFLSAKAQENTGENSFRRGFDMWLNIGTGPRLLDTDPGMITTYYVDDSPSRDNFRTVVDVKDQYNRASLSIQGGYAHPFNLSHSVIIDLIFGKARTSLFGYSLGYNQKFKIGKDRKIIVRPALAALLGGVDFKLGKIQNNASFIQIGNDRYFDDELNVTLVQNAFVLAPQLDIFYIFPNEIGLNLNIAYDFNFERGSPKLAFSRKSSDRNDDSREDNNSHVNLGSNNVSIDYNGNEIKKLPYKYGGLRITLAFSLYGEY